MKDRIELLMKLGLTKNQAIDFVKSVAQDGYEYGYYEGTLDEPAIIGESLGKSGMDFYEWWKTLKIESDDKN
jgi:hypothetical protein